MAARTKIQTIHFMQQGGTFIVWSNDERDVAKGATLDLALMSWVARRDENRRADCSTQPSLFQGMGVHA